MANLITLAKIPEEEVITRLFGFYRQVESFLEERLDLEVWQSREQQEGAKTAIDTLLRRLVRDSLSPLVPGTEIRWDEQLHLEPVYSGTSIAVVDLVDGARQYSELGSAVTSHLGIYQNNGGSCGQMQVGLVSYPFHRYRVLALGEGKGARVFWVPFSIEFMDGDFSSLLEQHQMPPRVSRLREATRLVDRYRCFDEGDPIRRNLDTIRKYIYLNGDYKVDRGSIAKQIVDVAMGVVDIVIYRSEKISYRPPLPFYDYLTPSRILRAAGGYFTDLQGRVPKGNDSIEGFIAAGDKQSFAFAQEIIHGTEEVK